MGRGAMSGRFFSKLVAFILPTMIVSAPQARADEMLPAREMNAPQSFEEWLGHFRANALEQGIGIATIETTFAGMTFNPRVVALDRAQPDISTTSTPARFSDYLVRRLTADRINRGRQMRSDISATLEGVSARFGVPTDILLGVWGMETFYGADTGRFDAFRSLASLAYDGRRAELFRRELMAALQIVDRGLARRDQLTGSWAGAMGQTQFLPSSYLNYAVDHDGDSRSDIWNSQADALASIANYLARNGWQRGQGWGMRVIVPAGLDRERVRDLVRPKSCVRVLEKHSRWLPISEWRSLGLVPVAGKPWPADDTLATLVEPDGPGNGGYLTYGNYRALLAYNCSNFYALSVAELAEAVE